MLAPLLREHFHGIARRYRHVRSLDARAVRRIAKALARERPVTVAALVEALPLASASFDAVLSFNALHHLALARALATFRDRIRASYRYSWAIPVRNNHLLVFAERCP